MERHRGHDHAAEYWEGMATGIDAALRELGFDTRRL
jgi:hypothetical protein